MEHTKMKKTFTKLLIVFFVVVILSVDGRKTSRSRSSSSSRGSGRKSSSNSQPAPTSFISPQASAPKPSLFGWQEKPAQKTQISSSKQSKPTNSHSYPSSNTGLSGNNNHKQPPVHQESIQSNNAPLNVPPQQAVRPGTQSVQNNNQMSHSYPASNGLSGSSGNGAGYPQGSGLSGSNVAHPPNQAVHSPNTYHGQSGTNYNNMGNNHAQGQPPPYSNVGNNYHHSQGPPPPYSNVGNNYHHPPPPPAYSNYGPSYGGYGGHGNYNPGLSPQMPGYFGNYGGKSYGGMSRTSSALTGVGIAGAGVGTILTGLALWNLARSTGQHRHTVIYDNRGQPVAVAPDNNNTATAMESMLGDLINCTLTINNENVTEILAIPCAIATSFTPEADVKDVNENKNENDNTKCTITIVTKAEREFTTTIPCSVLLNTAAENNVTEPPLLASSSEAYNATIMSNDNVLQPEEPSALKFPSEENNQDISVNSNFNCTSPLKVGEVPDPINPCFPVTSNLTVIPLNYTEGTNL